MPFSSAEISPASRRAYSLLALLLAAVAGAVNAISFFVLGTHTSHMTGNLANVGEYLASGNWALALTASELVLAFLLGAMTATVLMDLARHWRRGRHATALLVEALTLGAAGLWNARHPAAKEPTVLLGMAYAMGIQNALVTRVSGAVVRTTHITGVITDIGIQLVKMMTWIRDGARGHGLGGLVWMIRRLPTAEQFARTRLHLGLASSFVLGCTVGPLLLFHFGSAAMAGPCSVLGLLVVLDVSPAGAYAPMTPGV